MADHWPPKYCHDLLGPGGFLVRSVSGIAGVLMLAAAVLAGIVRISPRTTVIANAVSGEVCGIDFVGSLPGVDELSAQKRAARD